ncbi:MAG: hypothetical protein ABI588_10625 [Arenimonas sp.]
MSAIVHDAGRSARTRPPMPRLARAEAAVADCDSAWLVDVLALSRCRELLAGRVLDTLAPRVGLQALLDVPLAYEQFCRSHFASVQRVHPGWRWSDACQAYAIAMTAHALLFDARADKHECLLARHWDCLRGESRLDWRQARSMVSDGCSALARLDPLAVGR